MKTLRGKTAIVTGAASGIGRATAIAFAEQGAMVVVTDLDLPGAEAVAAKITESGGDAVAIACDVGKDGEFERVRDRALTAYDRIDVIMNNAGTILSGHPEDIPLAEWQRVFNVNLMGIIRSNEVFLPILLAQQSGHIVNTSSFAGLMTYSFDRLPYAASKAAVFQLSEGLALYLRPKGIGVTVLCPGPVATGIMRGVGIWTDDVVVRGPGEEFTLLQPEEVATGVIDAILSNRFFLPTHAAVTQRLVERATDFDAVLADRITNPVVLPIPPAKKNRDQHN